MTNFNCSRGSESGNQLNAFALAIARAFVNGGSTASSVANAVNQAIANNSCDSLNKLLTSTTLGQKDGVVCAILA